MKHMLFALALFLPTVAAAQSPIINPKEVVVAPTAQHDAKDPLTGQFIITSYTVEYRDGTTVIKAPDIGKPAITGAVTASAPVGTFIYTLDKTGLQNNRPYTVVVIANGQAGTTAARSVASDPFVWGTVEAPVAVSKPVVR